jgi:TPR repeat protein
VLYSRSGKIMKQSHSKSFLRLLGVAILAATLACLSAGSFAGIAEDYEAMEPARRAYEQGVLHGDYSTALRLLRPLADRGLAAAQVLLGKMYSQGQGVPQDETEAAKWFRKAADQGNATAQWYLGAGYLGAPSGPTLTLVSRV